jgi:hypothetical protein
MVNIDINRGRSFTDFGQGFYVTKNYEQAHKWAIEKYKDHLYISNIKPAIVKLEIDTEKLELHNGLHFDEPTDKWADFVYNCRKIGKKDEVFHHYDYVCGPLADGKIVPLINKRIKNEISLEEFHQEIQPKIRNENQLSFHNSEVLGCIKKKEVLSIEKLTLR